MIKIIKNGQLPKIYKTLFSVECHNCGCEFEFEIEDFNKIEKRLDGNYYIECPQCNREIVGKYEYFNPQAIEVVNEVNNISNFTKAKQYLKWENLIFMDEAQKIKVKLNNEEYTVVYCKTLTPDGRKCNYVGILKNDDIVVYSIKTNNHLCKQFFDDLHLEVIG